MNTNARILREGLQTPFLNLAEDKAALGLYLAQLVDNPEFTTQLKAVLGRNLSNKHTDEEDARRIGIYVIESLTEGLGQEVLDNHLKEAI